MHRSPRYRKWPRRRSNLRRYSLRHRAIQRSRRLKSHRVTHDPRCHRQYMNQVNRRHQTTGRGEGQTNFLYAGRTIRLRPIQQSARSTPEWRVLHRRPPPFRFTATPRTPCPRQYTLTNSRREGGRRKLRERRQNSLYLLIKETPVAMLHQKRPRTAHWINLSPIGS